MPAIKVAQLTSVHSRYDTRIFVKQCQGLAANGYDVTLVVADGEGDEQIDGLQILDVGRPAGRLERVLHTTRKVLQRAKELDADIYHLHDPELIPAGLRLRRAGKRVIFDAHEDVPKQILVKPYLGPVRLRILARLFSWFERFVCSRFDAIIAATPSIGDKFQSINSRTVVINNFPLLNELHADASWEDKKDEICYVGVISEIRGIREIVASMGQIRSPARLVLAGTFAEADTERVVEAMPGWSKTTALGFVDRERMRQLLGQSMAGLVVFHPLPNHVEAQPNKMFEYMSAGIPVIASDFPLWREIINGNECGICVDPEDPAEIAAAIDKVLADRSRAERLGANGRRAVLERYNWPAEQQKLFSLYCSLTDVPAV